jgi:hypothetical protein
MVSQFVFVLLQKVVQGQLIYIALTALIQEGLQRLVELDGVRRDNRLEAERDMMTLLVALTRQIIRSANAIRIALLYCVDVHRIQSAPELGGAITDNLNQGGGRLRGWAVPVAKILSVAKACYQAVDGFIITNKGRHFDYSFSKVQALTRLRFLSRETGAPNKSLRMKRKIPYSLDALDFSIVPITCKAQKGYISPSTGWMRSAADFAY